MKNLKNTIYCIIVLLVSSYSNANEKQQQKTVVTKKSKSADICSITYIVREHIGSQVITSEYTLTATTCEQVEKIAIDSGIIKAKK